MTDSLFYGHLARFGSPWKTRPAAPACLSVCPSVRPAASLWQRGHSAPLLPAIQTNWRVLSVVTPAFGRLWVPLARRRDAMATPRGVRVNSFRHRGGPEGRQAAVRPGRRPGWRHRGVSLHRFMDRVRRVWTRCGDISIPLALFFLFYLVCFFLLSVWYSSGGGRCICLVAARGQVWKNAA